MKVLFICVHNAGRSRMAEAFFNKLAPEGFEAVSAGTAPAEAVNPVVAEAMAEVEFDLGGGAPTLLTGEMVSGCDMAITMGCGAEDVCPLYLGLRIDEDWGLDDPAGQPLEKVRVIRDAVRARVEELLARISVKHEGTT